MANIFERLGHEVDYPSQQTCCGQPAFNSGYHNETRSVARHFVETFAASDAIVVPSGSCATMIRKFYPELFEEDEDSQMVQAVAQRTFEFAEFLVDELKVVDLQAEFSGLATYHDGCHGLRELGIKSAPRKLLEHVAGLQLVEMKEAESCCGFGGTFSVKFPQVSTSMAEVKLESATATEANYLISGDPSCLMQIRGFFQRQNSPIQCLHLAEVLDNQTPNP